VEESVAQEPSGMFQSIKEHMNLDTVVDQIRQSKDILIEVGIYASIGFFTGYLIKRYSSLLVMMVVCVGFLLILSKLDIVAVVVNWDYICQQLGIQSSLLNTESISVIAWEWARTNALLVSSMVIGFLVGLRVG
jgi:uncharacterized membrane protein (Fun14 family)